MNEPNQCLDCGRPLAAVEKWSIQMSGLRTAEVGPFCKRCFDARWKLKDPLAIERPKVLEETYGNV